jgi:hypothetical protein
MNLGLQLPRNSLQVNQMHNAILFAAKPLKKVDRAPNLALKLYRL